MYINIKEPLVGLNVMNGAQVSHLEPYLTHFFLRVTFSIENLEKQEGVTDNAIYAKTMSVQYPFFN